MKIAVSIHRGHAAIGEIGASEPPTLMAIGEVIDLANDLRKAAAERGKAFAISEAVYAEAALSPAAEDKITIGSEPATTAFLSDAAPIPSPTWTLHGEVGRRAMLRRLWAGG